MKILIVDDNPDGALAMSMLLGDLWGHDVKTCGTAQEALALLDHDFFDVVIADIQLPGKSGFDLAHEFRTHPFRPECVLVCLTGYAHPTYQQRALAAGFDLFRVKPCDPLELVEAASAMRKVLSSVQRLRQLTLNQENYSCL